MKIGRTKDGVPVDIDLDSLLKTRLLVTASSGGGKTGALFALCEQFSGKVQIIVLDPEGEFAPLRQKFPFLLVGPDGETPAMVKTAKLLAHRLLELNVSAICDIYELPVHQRHEFVRDFLEAMVDAPKSLWHPVIVIVDEAHVYGPEKGQGDSVALQSMVDMASRGRKRGFCLVAATQRLAKLSKNIASELQNQLVGRTTQVDQGRAADVLNLSGKTVRDDFGRMIGHVPTADFMAYGMAFGLTEPTRFTVNRPLTLPAGQEKSIVVPPAPESVKALLPKLADLPAEVERKVKSEEELRAELRAANKRIKELESAPSSADEETMNMLKEKLEELSGQIGAIEEDAARYKLQLAGALRIAESLVAALSEGGEVIDSSSLRPMEAEIRQHISRTIPSTPRPVAVKPTSTPPVDGEPLSGPEQRILNALAWMEAIGVDDPEQPAVAFLAGYTYGSGGYNNPRGRLRQRGLVEYVSGDRMKLTTDGKKSAQYPDIELSNEALHQAVLGRLPGPEGRILSVLLRCYPKPMDSTKLAEASGYTPGSGGFNNPRGRLKTLGLVEYPSPGMVAAKNLLFPEGR